MYSINVIFITRHLRIVWNTIKYMPFIIALFLLCLIFYISKFFHFQQASDLPT